MSQARLARAMRGLARLRARLNEMFVGRGQEVTAVLAGLVSGEPVILVGPPGTAKTMLVERMASMIGARYFYYLLSRFTEPDELLGPIDVVALRRGEYRRVGDGRLLDAEIVFLDEVFRGGSAIRNMLLDIILNKRVLDAGGYRRLPMLALYTASNQISREEEDAAFYDRLLIRAFVRPVGMDQWEDLIVAGVSLTDGNPVQRVLSLEDVRALQVLCDERFRSVAGDEKLRRRYVDALGTLQRYGVDLTDRRKIKLLRVAAALSIVWGEERVTLDDIADAMRYVAPHDENELDAVEAAIAEAKLTEVAEIQHRLRTIMEEVRRYYEESRRNPSDARLYAKFVEAHRELLERTQEIRRFLSSERRVRYVVQLKRLVQEALELTEETREWREKWYERFERSR